LAPHSGEENQRILKRHSQKPGVSEMRRVNFDLDVLRSFTTGVELGSFSKAAERLNKSTSAVSAPLKKLEEQAGVRLLRRSGRTLTLTEPGEIMLAYARRLLDLNDEAATAVRGGLSEEWIRLGLQEDFADILPAVLARFVRAHPEVRLEARLGRNAELLGRIASGHLDVAFAWDDGTRSPRGERIADVPMRWIGPAGAAAIAPDARRPIPLVSFEAPCILRSVAAAALDKAGLAWRVNFTSPTLGGLWAAVAAGLGLAVRTGLGMPATVRPLGDEETFLPQLPHLGLMVYRSTGTAGARVSALERAVTDVLSL
jgi:DNA-binding transcriptional LysR family regulator